MSLGVPRKDKYLSRVTIDDVGFYYSKGCKILPRLHQFYIDQLTLLESQGKVCLMPATILERYHTNLKKRLLQKVKTASSNKR